ncbi:hypothetical protein [Burkholderia sp. AU31652]|uniref:hypothetical protein n=1 Tax=Burkholderia sp. AU31652 TaxID=2015354 RepID=UPI00117753E0|nr:hypothetical protein [Burkholderia sp. AU31652]
MSEHPHCFPHMYPTGLIHLSKRCGDFFNRTASCYARLAPAHAHSSHYLKNRTKLTTIRDIEAKKPQSGRKCCARGMNGKNCAVVARQAERHTAGADRLAGGGPLQTTTPPNARPRGGAYATAIRAAGRAFFHGKLT